MTGRVGPIGRRSTRPRLPLSFSPSAPLAFAPTRIALTTTDHTSYRGKRRRAGTSRDDGRCLAPAAETARPDPRAQLVVLVVVFVLVRRVPRTRSTSECSRSQLVERRAVIVTDSSATRWGLGWLGRDQPAARNARRLGRPSVRRLVRDRAPLQPDQGQRRRRRGAQLSARPEPVGHLGRRSRLSALVNSDRTSRFRRRRLLLQAWIPDRRPARLSFGRRGRGTFRQRAPFASAAAAAEEDQILDDDRDENPVPAPPLDETLLRRRKYRARGSYTPSTPVSASASARAGGSADLSARSRQILDEINARGGGGGVASSSAVQDPALRRTATVETLRGARTESRAGSTTVDEFGSVSGGAGSQTVPRSRTTNDLLLHDDADRQRSETGRSGLGRSASTTASTPSSRTYGYRSGSRAAQVLASVRPSTAASQHYDSSPAMTTGRTSRTRPSSHREDVLPPPPPPSLPTSTSMYQLRNAPPVRERAATALDTTEARDREQRRWGYSVSPMGGEEAGRTRRTPLSSADRASRDMLFGARRRGGAEQQDSYSSSPNHAGRAATSLGTASLTRRQRDRHLDIHSLSDDDNDKRDGDHFEPRSVIRAGTSLGTPDRSRRHNGRDELSDREMRRRQVNGSEQFSGAAAGRTMDDMLDDESELERTPRSGKKTSGGGTAIPSTGSRDNG